MSLSKITGLSLNMGGKTGNGNAKGSTAGGGSTK